MAVFNVTIDCVDPHRLAAFYGALLDLPVAFEGGAYVVLRAPVKGGANIVFQQVPDPTPGKSKAHLDLHIGDIEAATAHAVSLGGSPGDDVSELGMQWRTMRDPEGNPFCLSAATE